LNRELEEWRKCQEKGREKKRKENITVKWQKYLQPGQK
jgi:hypothetical protein